MSNVLKWILYVLLGLVVLAVIAGIVFAFIGPFRTGFAYMRPGFRMIAPYGHFGFAPFGAIFGGLLGLGIIILIIIGIVALVSALVRGNRPAMNVQPQQPAQPVVAARTCHNCGKPAQEDWKTCPYCGTPLT
jgi:hypothetical protein